MAKELKRIDISNVPELLRIVEEVRSTNERRILRQENQDVAIVGPLKRTTRKPITRGRPTSADDPLWKVVGIGASEGAGDVSTNKHKYPADAYVDLHKWNSVPLP